MPSQQLRDKAKEAAIDWGPFDNGRTIGTKGLENGTIIFDIEHISGARVTVEKGAWTAPFVTGVCIGSLIYQDTRYDMSESDALCFANRTAQKLNILFEHLDIPNDKRDMLWKKKYNTLINGLMGV